MRKVSERITKGVNAVANMRLKNILKNRISISTPSNGVGYCIFVSIYRIICACFGVPFGGGKEVKENHTKRPSGLPTMWGCQ